MSVSPGVWDGNEPLTPEQKLFAELVAVDDRIPVGYQYAMPDYLDRSIHAVEKLFTDHDFPLREEIIRELTLWRNLAEQALPFSRECDRLMQLVLRDAAKMLPGH